MTEPATAWPHRFRLHGISSTHAARVVDSDPDRLLTACGHKNGARDERKPDDAEITCRPCSQEMHR